MQTIPEIEFLKTEKVEIEFEVFTLQSLFARKGGLRNILNEPHRVNFYQFLYITEGKGTHYVDFHPYRFRKGNILIVAKGQVQTFELATDRDGFLILFTDKFLLKNLIHSDILSHYRLYNYYLHSPLIDVSDLSGSDFGGIIKEIYREYYLPEDFAKEDILRQLLRVLLLMVERHVRGLIPPEHNTDWINTFSEFKSNLEKSYTETRNATDYANLLNISYKHLNTICRAIVGDTAKKCIDNFVILEIKRRLAVSDISVKELTCHFDFDEPTNFIKYFKKHTSMTPSQFKRSLKK